MKIYSKYAEWFRLLSPPADYRSEAALFARLLVRHAARRPRTLLELGSGGGHNASHLKRRFAMTLVDLSPAMLRASRRLNPECRHLKGDMRTLRLGRTFDAVFVQDAILHMTTERDLRRAVATAFAHLRPGGVALFAPDHVRETYQPSEERGGVDEGDRGLRYVQWDSDPDPRDTWTEALLAYVLFGPGPRMKLDHDRFRLGLFPRAAWMGILRDAGFRAIREKGVDGRDAFIGCR